ncbi:DNA repair protein [Brevibacillus gelatini]|uniref:DNA repair protein n=1 Tax=Brevibacillus gelatini TaxID=1655277 RepID=A0A3M8AR18_9BACL|nr:JAB domain-containing protein [Brevibacillus gelatini]RNB53523.1 DNA repair protein [Brevibacillus gelatini]
MSIFRHVKKPIHQFILNETALVDTVKPLLKYYDGSRVIKTVSEEEISQIVGVSISEAKELQAILQLAHLLSSPDKPDRYTIRMPRDAYKYCNEKIEMGGDCQTILLSLSTKNHVVNLTYIDTEAMVEISTYQRFVFRHLILRNAASGILVHIEKEGDLNPTPEQITEARIIAQAGDICGIPLLDVINITQSEYLSFKDKGLI